VAARTGVSRTTLYRWWPTPTDLLREALALHTRRLEPIDTGSWAGDVEALIVQLRAFLADPIERAQNAILASGLHPDFNAFIDDYYAPIVRAWRAMVGRGIERGEVRPDTDPDAVIAILGSPLLVITVLQGRTPTARECAEIGRLVIRGTAPSAPAARRTEGTRARVPRRRRALRSGA